MVTKSVILQGIAARIEKEMLSKLRAALPSPEQTFDGSTESFLKAGVDLHALSSEIENLCRVNHVY